jgi:hypothetical protein
MKTKAEELKTEMLKSATARFWNFGVSAFQLFSIY